MELFHTPDTMPDAPNKGSNTRSKPAGLGNQVAELHRLGLLPGQEELPMLPTPSAVDGSGGSMQQSLESLREGRRQRHLTDLPRLLDLEAEELPLLRTPQAQVTEPKPGIKLEGRSPSDPQVGLADQVLADFHGDLLPTPVVNDMGAGKTPEQWDEWTGALKSKGYNGNGHGRSLSVEVQREMALLPTPQTRDATGGKPEAVNRGRGYGADLNDVAAAGLLDGPLLPTPMSRDHQTGKRYALDPSHRFGPNLNDVATAGGFGEGHPVLPTPMARDHRPASPAEALRHSPGLSSIGALLPTPRAQEFSSGSRAAHPSGTRKSGQTLNEAVTKLLPTPAARDATGGVPSRLDRTQGAFLNDVAAAGLLPGPDMEKVKLLPTPTTLDHVEKRTTHAGGNPTLQGAICGTNPVDAERLGIKDDEVPLMPTPQATDHMCGSTSLQGRIDSNRQVMLPHVVRDLPIFDDDLPVLPTPMASLSEHRRDSGADPEKRRAKGKQVSLADEVCYLPGQRKDLPLLPTPKAHDGVFGTPRTSGRPIEKSTHLQTIVSLMGLPDEEPGMPILPILPTPKASDCKSTDSEVERSRNTPSLTAISMYYDTGLDDGQDDGADLMPTPQARGWKGAPGRNYKNRNLARDMERLAAEQATDSPVDEPEPETVTTATGDEQFVLFPTPNVGASRVGNSPGEMSRRTPALGAIVADLVDNAGPLLPTPNVAAREVRNSPGEMARLHPALGAVVADLAENGEESRFHGPLLPTPVVTDSCGTRNSTAWRSDPESKAKIGDTLTDAMWKLAAERGEMVLPDGPMRGQDAVLLPTPTSSDGSGGGVRTGLTWEGTTKSTGEGGNSRLRDVVGLFAQENPVLPTPCARDGNLSTKDNPSRRDHQVDLPVAIARDLVPLLPTPVAQDGNGHMQDLAADVGNNGRSVSLGDVVSRLPEGTGPLLPTPRANASDGMATSPAERRAKRQSVSLSEAVGDLVRSDDGEELFPTPVTQEIGLSPEQFDSWAERLKGKGYNGNGRGRSLAVEVQRLAADSNHMVKLIDAVLDGELQHEEELMPTPKTAQRGDCPSERERNSPDLAATTHHFPAGRWGKYGPAVERWEKLTRPAPAPTEPNKNGNPRLTARFSEWLLGWPEGWVTDPEIGVSRTGQLRLIGNGVVPQQAATALVMLLRQMKEEQDAEGTA